MLSTKPGRPPLKTEFCVLMTLWTMANQEAFRSIADRFGIGKGCAHTVFMETCKEICYLQEKYIKWPTDRELLQTVQSFNNLRGLQSFPNVVGCVDSTHIEIKTPRTDNSFYNRKGYTSMQIQAICNSTLEFINIFSGWPGSSHDARIWQNSPIYGKLKNENILPEKYHLLGDTAYPLDTFVMFPYKDNGHLTASQKQFNKRLSSSRVVIEQAFGRLKEVFRRLKYLNISKIENFKYITLAACILHNFSIKHNVSFEIDDHLEDDDNPNGDYLENGARQNVLAVNKREHIRLRMNYV